MPVKTLFINRHSVLGMTILLNHIMPVVSDHLRFLFNRHRKTELTKRVNAKNTVRQFGRDLKP